MQKYKQVFIRQFDRTLGQWQASGKTIAESEVYRLLHSIKGTGATIGLQEWTDEAALLLQHLDEESGGGLSFADAMRTIAPIVRLRAGVADGDSGQSADKPTADGRQANATSEEPAAGAPTDAQSAAGPAKALVLLVDDDVTLLQMFKERLEAEGCLVLATPFPDKAIRWFYELKPDCIVLDVVLPGHSGYELMTVLQQRLPQLLVPVILMSAHHEQSDRMKAYVLGADDFLAKPIDPDEFAVRVLNKIRRKQSIAKLMLSNESKVTGPGSAPAAEGAFEQATEVWRIAILDDDPIIRNMLQRRLKDWQLDGKAPEVRTFADGSAFFDDDWHRQKGNYLLVLDRMMPKINGIEVLTRLRADYPADRYRIIMLTGVGEQEKIAQAMRLGTDDYVTKPFRLPELEARMLRFLQGSKG
ncbi:MAG: hypothetical protein K0R28_2474 [Paenibacillus sp.]|jgi:DNA-binding response OmpR family regulator|nr:hypothetical protein [Paenibacillus sp.]